MHKSNYLVCEPCFDRGTARLEDCKFCNPVSKATLYSYFPDKRLLFVEVASEQCRQQSEKIMAEVDADARIEDILTIIGCTMLEFFYSDTGIRMFRVVLGETERFPELGHEFYQSGPGYGREAMASLFEMTNARGETRIDDIDLAASQFIELCKSDLWAQIILGVKDTVNRAEIEHVVQESIKMFMARYGSAQAAS